MSPFNAPVIARQAANQDERDEQMRRTHAEHGTVRRAAMDQKRNECGHDHEREERDAKRPMPIGALPAEQ